MAYRTLLLLLLAALPVRAQIAVSANDATEILVDGVRVMVANALPDTLRGLPGATTNAPSRFSA